MSGVRPFDEQVNRLLGWVQNEMGRGRLTGVQAAFLSERIAALERTHKDTPIVVEEAE